MKNEVKTILKKSLSFSLGSWINAFISFFSSPLLTWILDPSSFGKAAMFSSLITILSNVASIGSHNSLLRFYYQKDLYKTTGELFWSIAFTPMLLSVASSIILFIFRDWISVFITGSKGTNVWILISIVLILSIIQGFIQTILKIKEMGIKFSTLRIIQNISQIASTLLYAIFVSKDFTAIIVGQITGIAVYEVFSLGVLKDVIIPIKIRKHIIMQAIKFGFPFIFSGIAWWLLGWIDRITLRAYVSFDRIGIYSVGFKFSSMFNILFSGFLTYWLPYAYKQYEENPNHKENFKQIFNLLSAFVLLFVMALVISKDLIFYLFSPKFREASSLVPLLLSPAFLTALTAVSRIGIDFTKKTYWFIVSDFSAAYANLMGNLLLVPKYGITGAALSTGLSYTLIFVIESWASNKLYPIGLDFKRIGISIAIYQCLAIINAFNRHNLSNYLGMLLVLLIYLALYKNETEKLFGILVHLLKEIKPRH